MTRFLTNILEQPHQLLHTLSVATERDWQGFEAAGMLLREAHSLYISGMGSSWHAALALGCLLRFRGIPASLIEASELLHFGETTPGSVVVLLSRSGRSVEIVNLLEKAQKSGARVLAITCSREGDLARRADCLVIAETSFDHLISVKTYSSIALIARLVVAAALREDPYPVVNALRLAFEKLGQFIDVWRERTSAHDWFESGQSTYFLASGSSIATCHEARLLWEEGAKCPASAMSTGGFRHGPQEIIRPGIRFGIWIDKKEARDQDLATARDIRRLRGTVMAIGQDLPTDAGDLILPLPSIPSDLQYIIDVLPAQIAAERMAFRSNIDPDSFRVCPYVVETEYGLGVT